MCFERSENEAIPGCEEVGNAGTNYCFARPENYLWIMGDDGTPEEVYPLGICEGNCDVDADCAEGLACFQREGSEEVPGCEGAGQKGMDYCYLPSSLYVQCNDDSDCTEDEPLCVSSSNEMCSDPPCGICERNEGLQSEDMKDIDEVALLGQCEGPCDADARKCQVRLIKESR